MFIIKNKKIFLGLSFLSMIVSIVSIFVFGVRPGIDFTGGSILEVSLSGENEKDDDVIAMLSDGVEIEIPAAPFESTTTANNEIHATGSESALLAPPSIDEIKAKTESVASSTAEALIQKTGEDSFIIRTKHLSEEDHKALVAALSFDGLYIVEEKRFNTIGPTIGAELRNKAWVAVLAVMLGILSFIAFAFRHVSKPVASWKYGIIAIVALLHDVLLPTGIMALLGGVLHFEADVLFITALLTILGFSVHDTIVVFDRVRENLSLRFKGHKNVSSEEFAEVVGLSLEQTIVRSINTSLTVVFVLIALLWVGPPSIFAFALILLVGILAGTYSSIFLASPLLVLVSEKQKNDE